MKNLCLILSGLFILSMFLLPGSTRVVSAGMPRTAGDEFWDDKFFVGGPGGSVTTLSWYQNELIVGGAFRTAGKALAYHLAKWNGAEWQAVGTPPLDPACPYRCYMWGKRLSINASVVYAGKLVVGGYFQKTIVSWDGSQWEFLGGGLEGPITSSDGDLERVETLAVIGDDLFAGGSFYKPGTTTFARLLRWDGANWSEVDGSAPANDYDYHVIVHALVAHGDDLYVAGGFSTIGGVEANGIAKWNRVTNQWSALGDNNAHMNDVRHMIWYGDKLLVANGNQIQAWDGAQWTEFIDSANTQGTINALAVHNDELYVGGELETVNGSAVNNIAIWNGSFWRGLDKAIGGSVNAFLFQDDAMYVGGSFDQGDGKQALNVAKWDGANWNGLLTPGAQGIVGDVYALASVGTDVYVGGDFEWAGSARSNGLAKWDTLTQTWTPLGNADCEEDSCRVRVYALTYSEKTLYIGGEFKEIDGIPALNLAKWNGRKWYALGDWEKCCVRAIAVKNGNVYVGGTHDLIYQFDGQTWTKLGKVSNSPYYNPTANALAFAGNDLYVGGNFDSVNGVLAHNAARWDGIAWHDAGEGLEDSSSSAVNALVVRGKQKFAAAWSGVYKRSVNRWRRLGEDSRYALSVTRSNGKLFMSGTSTEFTPVFGVAQLLDGQWRTLGSGIALNSETSTEWGGNANVVVASGAQVFFGGRFDIVGEKPAWSFAVWTDPAPPRVKLSSPANNSVVMSRQPTLRWHSADGATTYQVQMRVENRRGKVVVDTTVNVAHIQTPVLKAAQNYLWRVRACNADGCSAWTGWWHFLVE